MNTKALLAAVVAELRAIPVRLSGDDSPLADPWEEIKSQVQEELSPFWPAYLDTIKQFLNGAVEGLAPTDLLAISSELKVPAEHKSQICHRLLIRLLARARKEKMRYEPFDYEYIHYTLEGLSIYSQIIDLAHLALLHANRSRYPCKPFLPHLTYFNSSSIFCLNYKRYHARIREIHKLQGTVRFVKGSMGRQAEKFQVRTDGVVFAVVNRQKELVADRLSGSIGPFARLRDLKVFSSHKNPPLCRMP